MKEGSKSFSLIFIRLGRDLVVLVRNLQYRKQCHNVWIYERSSEHIDHVTDFREDTTIPS